MKAIIIAFVLFLFLPSPACAESPAFLFGHEQGREQDEFEAARALLDSMLNLYAPSLKIKFAQYEKIVRNLTHFSGAISLRHKRDKKSPTIAGEAQLRNGTGPEKSPIHWSIKTSLDISSAAVGINLWRETPLGKISFAQELEQDFSNDFFYLSVLKLEKSF